MKFFTTSLLAVFLIFSSAYPADLPSDYSDNDTLPANDLNSIKDKLDGDILPISESTLNFTNSAGSLGSSTYKFKDAHLSGTLNAEVLNVTDFGIVKSTIHPVCTVGPTSGGWLLTSSSVDVDFTQEYEDRANMHDGTDPEQIRMPEAGTYLILLALQFFDPPPGTLSGGEYITIQIRIYNSSDSIQDTYAIEKYIAKSSILKEYVSEHYTWNAAAGDYITVRISENTSASDLELDSESRVSVIMIN